MRMGARLLLVLGLAAFVVGGSGAALAGDTPKAEDGKEKVAEGSKQIKEGAKEIAQATAADAEKGVTGFFKRLPWYSSPATLVIGFLLGLVVGKMGGGAPKKPGPPTGDKKK